VLRQNRGLGSLPSTRSAEEHHHGHENRSRLSAGDLIG
jgi:hypothetical protein